jgi:Cu+-exporting ATPase
VTGFAYLPGAGVQGTVMGRVVMVGSPAWFAGSPLVVPDGLRAAVEEAEDAGQTAVLAGWDGQARAVLGLGDALRPGGPDAIKRLKRLGLRTVLLTGDSERAARAVAVRLGIPAADVFAGVRPDDKADVIRRLRADGLPVAMAGDGINDAAALAQADLGMAIGTGTDAAIGAADLTLVSGEPESIADAVQLARTTVATIRTNLSWAFGYNVIAIPLAALGYLNPLFAGIAMSVSSLLVTSSSLRLRRFRPVSDR